VKVTTYLSSAKPEEIIGYYQEKLAEQGWQFIEGARASEADIIASSYDNVGGLNQPTITNEQRVLYITAEPAAEGQTQVEVRLETHDFRLP
jgi:hypothetical protein